MFTGLIADMGTIESAEAGSGGSRLRIATGLSGDISEGDSVAVNGCCLTATDVDGAVFESEVMNQTLSVTSLGPLGKGDRVNLELALRASDRLGGHIVQGHVDDVGTVEDIREDGFSRRLRVSVPDRLRPAVVARGSIAIDGVSLTVAEAGDGWLEVSLIPETLARTTLGDRVAGDLVNLETDVIAKYVENLVQPPSRPA